MEILSVVVQLLNKVHKHKDTYVCWLTFASFVNIFTLPK